MINKNGENLNFFKKILVIFVSLVIAIGLFSAVCVFAETAPPTKVPSTPTGKAPTNGPSAVASFTPSASPSPSPTATKEPEFLQDFTIPPLQSTENPNGNADSEKTAKPDFAGATIGIVEVDNIETKKDFMWSDIIKYLTYVFFAFAGVAVIYGIVCMAVLIFLKKDITFAGLRLRKKEKKKQKKNKE